MTYHDRDREQVSVRLISVKSIMRSAAFAAGVADARSGRPPAYDNYTFNQDAGEAAASRKINGHWNYERGRQFAAIAPVTMPVKIDGGLNPKAVVLYRTALTVLR
jgi:hypothetical protein